MSVLETYESSECSGCDWERHAQAFRWFPELGVPLRFARGVDRRQGETGDHLDGRPAASDDKRWMPGC
jgi:hypothetical protein